MPRSTQTASDGRPALPRRDVLQAGLAAGVALSGLARGADDKSLVVAAAHPKAPDQAAVQAMVDRAVARLVGEDDPRAAWKRLVKPADVVGIKASCLAGARLSTRIEVIRAIARSVRAVGVPPGKIVVWDRKLQDMVRAGYPVKDTSECIYIGNDHPRYGFGPPLILKGEIGSLFSRLVTRVCTVIINAPVLKDHDLAGVSVALKSAFGAIHNPNKYHFANLHQAIVDVNRVDVLRRKTVLHLCDATFACSHGGPTPSPRWVEKLGTVYASRDPVALDACGWAEIESLRKAKGLEPLAGSKREPLHIALAAKHGLGTSDLAKIELVHVEC